MLTIHPVIEVHPPALPAWTWLPLDGARTPNEVALFVAAVATSTDEPDLDAVLAASDLIVPGGLRIHDTGTGATVTPGCCCGLEDWREWLTLLDGGSPWLGHDPTPTIQHFDSHVRLWQDTTARGPYVDVPHARLPALLESVHHDLNAFLPLTGAWAGDRGPALMAALDRDFAITAPLEFPCDTATPAPPT